MISNIIQHTNKHSLARSIIALQNPKLEVFEVLSVDDVKERLINDFGFAGIAA